MRIGFSLLDLAMGGAQTFMVQLAHELADRGHELTYYLYASRSDKIHAVPSLLSELTAIAESVSRPKELLRKDIIQIDGYHNLRRKIPYLLRYSRCVETYHSIYSIRRSGPIYAPYRVSISQAVQDALHHSSEVIYPGIVLPDADRILAMEGNKEFDIAILGRIHPVKGHLLFLRVCEALFHQRGHLQALMIGGHPLTGPYQEQVDAEIQRLRGLGVRLHTTHDIPAKKVFTWLMRSRVLLVTSESEGFGRMAIEALACYLPVVINPIGGLTEIVLDGKTGFWAEYNNPTSFANLANRLLEDSSLRQQLGQQGRLHVEQHFSLQAVTDQYERLYRRVINAKG